MLRTLATVMDQTRPSDKLKAEFLNGLADLYQFTFILLGNKYYLVAWLGGLSADNCPGVQSDILVRGLKAKRATGIDILNGITQDLSFTTDRDATRIGGVILRRDYPYLLGSRGGTSHAGIRCLATRSGGSPAIAIWFGLGPQKEPASCSMLENLY